MATIEQKMVAAAMTFFGLAKDPYEIGELEVENIQHLFDTSAYGGFSALQSVANQIVDRFTKLDDYTIEDHAVIAEFLDDADISTVSEDETVCNKFSALSIALTISFQNAQQIL